LMKPDNATAIPLEIEQARQELEAWRSTHRPRCHIPDSLWKRAAELASQHGLYLTSRTLRVDYMRLKKLVQPTSPERKSAELPRFIELMAPTVAGIAECVVMAIMFVRPHHPAQSHQLRHPHRRGRRSWQVSMVFI